MTPFITVVGAHLVWSDDDDDDDDDEDGALERFMDAT